jgi:hypothetical protein
VPRAQGFSVRSRLVDSLVRWELQLGTDVPLSPSSTPPCQQQHQTILEGEVLSLLWYIRAVIIVLYKRSLLWAGDNGSTMGASIGWKTFDTRTKNWLCDSVTSSEIWVIFFNVGGGWAIDYLFRHHPSHFR